MKHLIAAALLVLTLVSAASAQSGLTAPRYRSNSTAAAPPPPDASACPGDTSVWVSTASSIYYPPGDKSYGTTKSGKYMCKKDADAAGYRMTKNGK